MTSAATRLQLGLPFAFTFYVLCVVVAHLVLPVQWTWYIGYAALLGMLLTYPAHAAAQGENVRLETGISIAFVGAGLVGLLVAPILLILAIAAHGLLDAVKYLGVGAAVPTWYLLGCASFDIAYAAFLFTHL